MIPPTGDRRAGRKNQAFRRQRGHLGVSEALVALVLACEPHEGLVGAQNPFENGKAGAGTSGAWTGAASGGAGNDSGAGNTIGGTVTIGSAGATTGGGSRAVGGTSAGGTDAGGSRAVGGTSAGGTYSAAGTSAGGTAQIPIGQNGPWPPVEAEPGKVPWEPWPEVDASPADACRVSNFAQAAGSAEPIVIWTETWEFNPATRVLSQYSDGTPTIEPGVHYVRFDSQGRRELEYSSWSHESEEWFRDQLGNTQTYRITIPVKGQFDPTTTYPEAREGARETTNYSHAYDAGGRLESTEIYYPGRGGRLLFVRDGQARCQEIWSEVSADPYADPIAAQEIQRFTYQGARLATRITTDAASSTEVRQVVQFGYDAQGTLASTVVDGYAAIPQPYAVVKPRYDGLADYIVRAAEQPDGSRWLEVLDFTRQTVDSEVLRDGVPTKVWRRRWHFSAGCATLRLPQRTSQDCEFNRPLYEMPVSWSDPQMTPIRPQLPVGAN